MKNNLSSLISILITVLFFSAVVFSQTTEFTYQGSLQNSSAPANGNYDFEFLLYDALSGGVQIGATLTRSTVAVSAGTFAVKLDFGPQFSGANRFIEIRVRAAGGGAFTPLVPRQPVSSSPYAVKSLNADQLSGFTADGFIRNQAGPQLATFNVVGNGIILGNVGIGTSAPQQKLHVDGATEILSTGTGSGFKFRDRGSLSSADDWVWYSNGNIARFFRPGAGDLLAVQTNGNVGIGTASPAEKLSVNGAIQSTTGGFKFPDGSVQTAAANTTFTTVDDTQIPMPTDFSDAVVLHLNLPVGTYMVSANVRFHNTANFFGQDNSRLIMCRFPGEPGSGDQAYRYMSTLAAPNPYGGSIVELNFHSILNISSGGVDVFCRPFGGTGGTNVFAKSRRLTAVKIEGNVSVQ